MNGNPYTSSFIGSIGIYQVQEDIINLQKSVALDLDKNTLIKAPTNKLIYIYNNTNTKVDNTGLSVYNGVSWLNVPQTLTTLNTNKTTNTNNIATLDGVVSGLTTLTTSHSAQITSLQAVDTATAGTLASLSASITALGIEKLNKTSLDGISVIYKDGAGNVQLKYNTTHFTEISLITGNTREFKLSDTYANLPTTIPTNINNASNDCYLASSNNSFKNSFDFTYGTSNNCYTA